MKAIKLPCFGIKVTLGAKGGGSIESALNDDAWTGDAIDCSIINKMDALESMILAHAIAGIDIESHAYIEGIETAVEACLNNY